MSENNKEQRRIRTQKIRIKQGHRLYPYFDNLCFYAKNLYNIGNYYMRQAMSGYDKNGNMHKNEKEAIEEINSRIGSMNHIKTEYVKKRRAVESKKPESERKDIKDAALFEPLSKDNKFVTYYLLDAFFKDTKQVDYYALPGQTNQQVLRQLMTNWKSFFRAAKDYKIHPEKYTGKPKMPKYADKNGRKQAVLSSQICTIIDNKYLRFPKLEEQLNIVKLGLTEGKLKEVRVNPGIKCYELELVFEAEGGVNVAKESGKIFGIDLGVNNFATIANNIGAKPMIVKGGIVKSINQFYNKKKSQYYSILRMGKDPKKGSFTSKRLKYLDRKRNDRIKDFCHKASRAIVNEAVKCEIDTIIVGWNKGIKCKIDLGKNNNQNFVQLPYRQFLNQLEYKAKDAGINFIITEESYTSKASFLDNDEIPIFQKENNKEYKFSGSRVTRGLYCSKDGRFINADLNGALNIIKKVVPTAEGIAACVTTPVQLSLKGFYSKK